MERDTYSPVGIGNSGYLVERNSDISSSVKAWDEQIYLPFAWGYSNKKIWALATSSTWTNDVFIRYLYCSFSPVKITVNYDN